MNKLLHMFIKAQTDWLLLSDHQRYLAEQNKSRIWREYTLAMAWKEKQTNPYAGNDEYVVLWDSNNKLH